MARQIRSKMGWDEGRNEKVADRIGLLRIIRNTVGSKHRINKSTSSMGYRNTEDFKAHLGFASVKEAESLLRTARMLQ